MWGRGIRSYGEALLRRMCDAKDNVLGEGRRMSLISRTIAVGLITFPMISSARAVK